MTTLIFLCLALIGAGVFLFAPQAWARGETPMLKILPAIVVVVLLASGCAGIAKSTKSISAHESIPAYEPISLSANLHDSEVAADYEKKGENLGVWLIRHCTTLDGELGKPIGIGFRKSEWDPDEYFPLRLLQKEQCFRAFANYEAAREKWWKHEQEEEKKLEERLVKQEKEEEERRARKLAELAKRIVDKQQAAKQKIAALKGKLKSKQFCDVVLEGTILLREVQDHNERGLGTKGEAARIPDGELHGIIEVAKQGCNPE